MYNILSSNICLCVTFLSTREGVGKSAFSHSAKGTNSDVPHVHYNPINNETNMSRNCTAYFSDARALLLTEHVIVLCVYAAHACSLNYSIDQISMSAMTRT